MPIIYAKHENEILKSECNLPDGEWKIEITNPKAKVFANMPISLPVIEVLYNGVPYLIATKEDDLFEILKFAIKDDIRSPFIQGTIDCLKNDYDLDKHFLGILIEHSLGMGFKKNYAISLPLSVPSDNFSDDCAITEVMFAAAKDIQNLYTPDTFLNYLASASKHYARERTHRIVIIQSL